MSELFKISTMTFESGWSMGYILSNDDFVAIAQGSYGDRWFVSKAGVTTANLAENELKGYWQRYCSRMEYGYTKMYDALRLQYEAIENYDRTEDTKTVNRGSDSVNGTSGSKTSGSSSNSSTNSGSYSDTTDGTELTKNQNSNDTLHKVSGYNDVETMTSESADNVSGNTSNDVTAHTNVLHSNNGESSGTSSNTTETNGTSGSTTTYGHEIAVSSRVHGNIGVTTNQQMIISELELRKFDLQFEIVKRFLNMYTIYWD